MDFDYDKYKKQMEQTDDGKRFVLEHTDRVTSSTIGKVEGFLATLKEESAYQPGINPELEGRLGGLLELFWIKFQSLVLSYLRYLKWVLSVRLMVSLCRG